MFVFGCTVGPQLAGDIIFIIVVVIVVVVVVVVVVDLTGESKQIGGARGL